MVSPGYDRAIQTPIFLAVMLAALSGARLAAQTQPLPAGVPAAPPGGVIASKMPDTNGVHLGMTQDQAIAVMKQLYPGSQLTIYYDKTPAGDVWTGHLSGASASSCSDGCESMDVYLSMPPSPVQVISISREITLAPGKQPTRDNTLASLRQKYGKELLQREGSDIHVWVYDEQGQPITPTGPSNWVPDCTGDLGVVNGIADPKTPMQVESVLAPSPLAEQVPNLVKNPCNQNVYVHVQIGSSAIQGTQVVSQITIILSEQSMMLRDAVAEQQYFNAVAAAKQQQQQQQQIKAAQQRGAPTL